jgi:hypothetical protein
MFGYLLVAPNWDLVALDLVVHQEYIEFVCGTCYNLV